MATERQTRANRANGQMSTRPTPPEGKRISSQNEVSRRLVSGAVALAMLLKPCEFPTHLAIGMGDCDFQGEPNSEACPDKGSYV
jgi:hypothetical protein